MADRFARRLAVEVPRWIAEGLISPPQGDRILARHPVASGWLSRPVVLFSLIGGALIVGGVALVVAHNWPAIPRGVKLGGVVALMALAYLGALAVRERGHDRIGEGLLLAGGGLLLVGVALIGQIYNLSGRPSDAVLVWWLLLLPAAYALPTPALAALGFLGAALWYAMAISDPGAALGASLSGSVYFAPMAIAAGGITAFGLGTIHGDGRYRRLRQLLEQLGLLGLVAGLLPLGVLQRWGESARNPGGGVSLALLALLGLSLLSIGVAAYRLPADSVTSRLGFLAVFLVLLLYLFVLKVVIGFGAPRETFRMLEWVNWLLVFVAALGVILYGARWGRTAWVNWGVVLIGVHAVVRYVDLFGTMLRTSFLFIGAGVFVLSLGWALERMRRRMLARAVAPPEGP